MFAFTSNGKLEIKFVKSLSETELQETEQSFNEQPESSSVRTSARLVVSTRSCAALLAAWNCSLQKIKFQAYEHMFVGNLFNIRVIF